MLPSYEVLSMVKLADEKIVNLQQGNPFVLVIII